MRNLKRCVDHISKLKDNKSSGNDGIISEFYKIFQDDISEFVLGVFMEAVELGKLPSTMSEGLVSQILKPGKDASKIGNWRPITLINNNAKLLALIFKV